MKLRKVEVLVFFCVCVFQCFAKVFSSFFVCCFFSGCFFSRVFQCFLFSSCFLRVFSRGPYLVRSCVCFVKGFSCCSNGFPDGFRCFMGFRNRLFVKRSLHSSCFGSALR